MTTRSLYLLAACALFTPLAACGPGPAEAAEPAAPAADAADLTASASAYFALDAEGEGIAARRDHPFLCSPAVRASRCPAAVDWTPLGPAAATTRLDQLARAGRLVVRGSWSKGSLGVREVLVRAGEDLGDDQALAALAALVPASSPPGLCGAALRSALESSAQGLLWPSESDYPISVTVGTQGGTGPVSIGEILALVGAPTGTAVEARGEVPLGQLGTEYPGIDEPGKAQAARFRALHALLDANLTGVGAYYVGSVDLKVVVVGRSRCGEIAGVISEAIET